MLVIWLSIESCVVAARRPKKNENETKQKLRKMFWNICAIDGLTESYASLCNTQWYAVRALRIYTQYTHCKSLCDTMDLGMCVWVCMREERQSWVWARESRERRERSETLCAYEINVKQLTEYATCDVHNTRKVDFLGLEKSILFWFFVVMFTFRFIMNIASSSSAIVVVVIDNNNTKDDNANASVIICSIGSNETETTSFFFEVLIS